MSVLNFSKKLLPVFYRSNFSISTRTYVKSHVMKVTLIGSAGHCGLPLCLTLKQSPLIDELAIHDICDTCGFARELGHIDTKCQVFAYSGTESISSALNGAKIVVVLASKARSAVLPYETMFEANATILSDVIEKYAEFSPRALLAICTEPINSMLPLACDILKRKGVFNPCTIFGVTATNGMRANTFAADVLGMDPENVFVPVIGGSFGKTIVPVFSGCTPVSDFTKEELEVLTANVEHARNDIIKLKNNINSTHGRAFAISRFITSLVKGLRNQKNVVECAYVPSTHHPDVNYLSTPILFGPRGIQRNLGIPRLNEYEICLLDNAVTVLAEHIKIANEYFKTKRL